MLHKAFGGRAFTDSRPPEGKGTGGRGNEERKGVERKGEQGTPQFCNRSPPLIK